MSQITALTLLDAVPGVEPELDPDGAIACVPWPSEAHRRTELAQAGVPRLLFIEPGHAPPELWDLDEDWVRVPSSADEVTLRVATLRSRLARHLTRRGDPLDAGEVQPERSGVGEA
ncbi:MAG: hypothetical protein ABW279_02465 [Acidimicrobiales bacterium]